MGVNQSSVLIVGRSVGHGAAGDRHAEFEVLFDTAFTTCVTVARRILTNAEQAEDVATEAFVRAWTRWWWLRRQPSPVGWLVRVSTNLALDHVRRGEAPWVPRRSASDQDDAVVLRLALVGALGHLSERQRAAIALRYLADLPEHDVALAMGVSTGSVKTHLHRGLARLRTTLDDPEATLAP